MEKKKKDVPADKPRGERGEVLVFLLSFFFFFFLVFFFFKQRTPPKKE